MRLRAPTIEDVPEITAAMNDVTQSLHGRDDVSEDEMRLWFEAPEFDPERDAVVALADNGAIAVYGDLSDPSREGRLVWLDLFVRPGVAEAMADAVLDELEIRAQARLGSDGRVKSLVDKLDTVLPGLLAARGYRIERHSFRMEADLAHEPEDPLWPDGIAVRTFRPGEDDRRVYEVQEETFADQLDHEESSFEEWRHWSFREPFDADLWFLAEDGQELAGILLARRERGGDHTLGWVSVLGVRRPWRRRGLARALLLHAFRELRARGKTRAGLGVDGANTTGAVDLYRQAGMRVVRQFDHWTRSAQS